MERNRTVVDELPHETPVQPLDYAVPSPRRFEKWAIASCALGLTSVLNCVLFGSLFGMVIGAPEKAAIGFAMMAAPFFFLLPIGLGLEAYRRIGRSRGQLRGHWLAFTGIAASLAWLGAIAAYIIFVP